MGSAVNLEQRQRAGWILLLCLNGALVRLFGGDHRVHLGDPVGLGLLRPLDLAVLGLLEEVLGVVPRGPRAVGLLLLLLRVERLVGDRLGLGYDAHPLQDEMINDFHIPLRTWRVVSALVLCGASRVAC